MRQVIVKKTKRVKEEVFDNFKLSFDEPLLIKTGLNKIKLENPILIMSGGKINWNAQLSEEMVISGIVMPGVYFKDEHIVAYVFNTNNQPIEVSAGLPVLELKAYETVSARQVSQEFNNVIVLEREESKKEESKALKQEIKKRRKGRRKTTDTIS